jgi:hypothetical protein
MHRSSVTRSLALALLPLTLAMPCSAPAQADDKTMHIGILSSGFLENRDPLDNSSSRAA